MTTSEHISKADMLVMAEKVDAISENHLHEDGVLISTFKIDIAKLIELEKRQAIIDFISAYSLEEETLIIHSPYGLNVFSDPVYVMGHEISERLQKEIEAIKTLEL